MTGSFRSLSFDHSSSCSCSLFLELTPSFSHFPAYETASWTNRAILLSYCSDVLNKAMPPPTTPDEVREATRKKPSEYSHLWEGEMEAPDKAGRRDVGRSEVEVLVSSVCSTKAR